MTPFWNPNFTPPPCGQLAVRYLYPHVECGPNFKLCIQIWILGPASYPVTQWPRPGWANQP